MKFLKTVAGLFFFILLWSPSSVRAESVTSANDGTGTSVAATDNRYDISGGTQVDGNLFHSFEQLGLSEGEVASFLTDSNIENILGRVVGGDPSVINGLMEVLGSDANLFLLNPAGVVFGPEGQLNLAGDFTATAATGIQLDDHWFSAVGENDFSRLSGTPTGFVFATEQVGSVINAGDLSARRIVLMGGMVVNTGTLSAPGGNITVEAVPGESVVTITQEGSLLSLGLPVSTEYGAGTGNVGLTPLTLPQLLSNQAGLGESLGVVVEGDRVRLTRSNMEIPTDGGVAIASGTIDVSDESAGATGGRIDVLGEQVALVDARLDASGDGGGGNIRIGGAYKGSGSVQNAERTYIGRNSEISADAITSGNGGQVTSWADGTTRYYGNISARGGARSGDGGFVEVSGEKALIYRGEVDAGSPMGRSGTLLLDPEDITIVRDRTGNDDSQVSDSDSMILAEDDIGSSFTISELKLEDLNGNTDVVLEATNNITIEDLNNGLVFKPGTGSITFLADADNDGNGSFSVVDLADEIEASGRNISISGASIIAGGIESVSKDGDGGDISLTATAGDIFVRYIRSQSTLDGDAPRMGGNINISAKEGIFRVTGVVPESQPNSSGDLVVSVQTGGYLGSNAADEDFDDNQRGAIKIETTSSTGRFNIGARLETTDTTGRISDRVPGQAVISETTDDVGGGSGVVNLELIPGFDFAEGESGSRGAILSRNFNGESDSSAHNSNSTGEGTVAIALRPPSNTEVREEEESVCEAGETAQEEEEVVEESCQSTEELEDSLLDTSEIDSE